MLKALNKPKLAIVKYVNTYIHFMGGKSGSIALKVVAGSTITISIICYILQVACVGRLLANMVKSMARGKPVVWRLVSQRGQASMGNHTGVDRLWTLL